MDRICWEQINQILPLITVIVAIVFGIIGWWQWYHNRKFSAFINVFNFLHEDERRKARRTLIETLKGKEYKDWSTDERFEAEKVCASYDLVGIMVTRGFIEKDLVLKEWHYSVVACWETAKPMIEYYRERQKRGKDYWDDFENLYKLAKEYV